MIVFFKATAEFSGKISRDFWRKLRANTEPFVSLSAVGGTTHGHFSGVVDLEAETEDGQAYEITALIVQKVELLSRVGVSRIDFGEITAGVQ